MNYIGIRWWYNIVSILMKSVIKRNARSKNLECDFKAYQRQCESIYLDRITMWLGFPNGHNIFLAHLSNFAMYVNLNVSGKEKRSIDQVDSEIYVGLSRKLVSCYNFWFISHS